MEQRCRFWFPFKTTQIAGGGGGKGKGVSKEDGHPLIHQEGLDRSGFRFGHMGVFPPIPGVPGRGSRSILAESNEELHYPHRAGRL